MPVATKEEVQVDLELHRDDLVECVRLALKDYAEEYAQVRHKHSLRSQASIIQDHIVYRLTQKYGSLADSEGDLGVHKKGNLRQLIFGLGKYKIRLKKLDKKLLTRNIQTSAVLEFNWQQESFEQIPPATNLHLGYQPTDDAAITSSSVWVTCPDGNRIGWSWNLWTADEAEKPIATVQEIRPDTAAPQRVKPRHQKETVSTATPKAVGDDDGSSEK